MNVSLAFVDPYGRILSFSAEIVNKYLLHLTIAINLKVLLITVLFMRNVGHKIDLFKRQKACQNVSVILFIL